MKNKPMKRYRVELFIITLFERIAMFLFITSLIMVGFFAYSVLIIKTDNESYFGWAAICAIAGAVSILISKLVDEF